MIDINTLYFLISYFFIVILLSYTSSKFLNIKIVTAIKYTLFYNFTTLLLFLLPIKNIDNFFVYTTLLSIYFLGFYLFSNKNKFRILLLCFKSYYIFLLSFTTVFSICEIITSKNIYELIEYEPLFFIVFIICMLMCLSLEFLILSNIDLNKLDYILSTVNIIVPISMFFLLISKNYSLFYILNFSRHSILISYVFLASTLLDIYFGVFCVIAISKSYNLSIYKHQHKMLNFQYEIQLNNLNQLKNHQDNIKRISHDINNHNIVLSNLIKEKNYDKALSYLNNFKSDFSDKDFECITNHKILNSLILSKKDSCMKHNINLDLDIKVHNDMDVSDFDICIIVGNLIDNAIEACKKLEDGRYIFIKSKIINDNFTFEIKNSFNGDINIVKNKFITSKKNTLNHGFGICNINLSVNKYNGLCEFTYDDKEFCAFVMIPLNIKES